LRTQFAIAIVAALAAIAAPGHAADTAQQANMKSCAANWNGMSAANKSKTSYKAYMSTCLKAPTASATTAAMTSKPAAATPAAMTAKSAAPATAMKAESGSAKCKDGKTVTYTHRSGTCSGHGGVATWM
jgi:prophage DNA circulation protein